MKKTLPILFFAMLTSAVNAQNIQNGDFEDWTNNQPDLWSSLLMPTVMEQVPGVSGHAVKISPEMSEGTYQPAALLNIDESTFNYTTIPAGVYQSAHFDYKLNLEGGDELSYGFIIYDASMGLVSSAAGYLENNAASFTHFEETLYSFSANTPHHIVVSFSISNNDTDPHPGSFFVVDNVDVSTTPATVESISGENSLSLYPNPCNEVLQVNIPESGSSLLIYDMNGAVVHGVANCMRNVEVIDMGNMAAGVYTVRVIGASGVFTTRVIRN